MDNMFRVVMEDDGTFLLDLTYINKDQHMVDTGLNLGSNISDSTRKLLHDMLDELIDKAPPIADKI